MEFKKESCVLVLFYPKVNAILTNGVPDDRIRPVTRRVRLEDVKYWLKL